MSTKTCETCEVEKPLEEFRRAPRNLGGDGHRRTCRSCEDGEEPATDPDPMLAIKPGYELRVWVDGDGDLVLAQEGAEGETRIYLAPHQVPALAQFLNPAKEATP